MIFDDIFWILNQLSFIYSFQKSFCLGCFRGIRRLVFSTQQCQCGAHLAPSPKAGESIGIAVDKYSIRFQYCCKIKIKIKKFRRIPHQNLWPNSHSRWPKLPKSCAIASTAEVSGPPLADCSGARTVRIFETVWNLETVRNLPGSSCRSRHVPDLVQTAGRLPRGAPPLFQALFVAAFKAAYLFTMMGTSQVCDLFLHNLFCETSVGNRFCGRELRDKEDLPCCSCPGGEIVKSCSAFEVSKAQQTDTFCTRFCGIEEGSIHI